MPQADRYPISAIPSRPGTYVLLLHLRSAEEIVVGKLGRFVFPSGFYVYVGSALGSGGLAGRIKHHTALTTSSHWRPRWHVDYLRYYTKTTELWIQEQPVRREHAWASAMRRLPGVSVPAPRFGASDCSCPAHLFHFPHHPDRDEFSRLAKERYPNDTHIMLVAGC